MIWKKRREITRLIEQWLSNEAVVRRLGEEYDFNIEYLRRAVSRRGLKANVSGRAVKESEIIKLHESWLGQKAIAKVTGEDRKTIRGVLKKNGRDCQKFRKETAAKIKKRRSKIAAMWVCRMQWLGAVAKDIGVGVETIKSDLASLWEEYNVRAEKEFIERVKSEHDELSETIGREFATVELAAKYGIPESKVRGIVWWGIKESMRKKAVTASDIWAKKKASVCRVSALRRWQRFNINAQELQRMRELQWGLCAYTLQPLDRETKEFNDMVSVDRIVNDWGYVKGNVCLTTRRINSIKHDMSLEEMQKWVPLFYKNVYNLIKKMWSSEL